MGRAEKDLSIQSDISKNKEPHSVKSGTTDAEKMPLKRTDDDKLEEAKFFNLFVTTSYIISDMKKKPRSYKIGVFTVTLTVTFCIVLYWVLDVMPVMFLKLSQNQVGESDLVYTALSPKNVSYTADNYMYDQSQIAVRNSISTNFYLPLVNWSKVIEETKNNTDFEGFTPRWFGVADFANTTNSTLKVSGVIMILDTEREVKIGLGREFTKTILGPGQAFLTNSALKYLQVEPNGIEKVQLVIDIRKYLNLMLNTNLVLTSNDITVITLSQLIIH